MLAKRELSQRQRDWARAWGVPSGRKEVVYQTVRRISPAAIRSVRHEARFMRARGPFAFQHNTSTRLYEYPWAYGQLEGLGPSRILEIGGALSGLQFVLALDGHEVHNVDPFSDYGLGRYDIDPFVEHAALNRAYRTDVVLHRSTLPDAAIEGSFDVALCISTIEHLTPADIEATLEIVKQRLAPGGLVVMTVDLFLNLTPFCRRTTNEWGSNVSVAWLDELLGYTMVAGDRRELYGYPEFSSEDILSRLEEFAMGSSYPQLAQLVSFRSPGP